MSLENETPTILTGELSDRLLWLPQRINEMAEVSYRENAIETSFYIAAYQARRIVRKLRLDQSHAEDIEQEILISLIERRQYFDPRRGPWTPFVLMVARQSAQQIADRLAAEGRMFDSVHDDRFFEDEDSDAFAFHMHLDGACLTESDHLFCFFLALTIRRLPAELRLVAELALEADGDLAEAQRVSGLSTSEFYRRLRELRLRLIVLSLAPRRLLSTI